ncbi:MAG: hypothetical protein JWN76_3398 [Chitinophagaceae bacterium]|nr:hypothetical protein [Chitinophagaceae bacterium]
MVETRPSKIDGKGCFALRKIPARKKIGNLKGEIISLRKARKLASAKGRIAIVEFGDGRALNATFFEDTMKYINHSCSPNTYMRIAFSRVEFYALKKIKKGEELTCDYGPTHHDGKLKCQCGSPACKGFL